MICVSFKQYHKAPNYNKPSGAVVEGKQEPHMGGNSITLLIDGYLELTTHFYKQQFSINSVLLSISVR
jgi:hypothetical protein